MVALLLFLSVPAFAGDRAEKAIAQADRLYENMAFREALVKYHMAADLGALNEHVCRRLGSCYLKLGDPLHAEIWFAYVVKYKTRTPEDMRLYAEVLKSNGKYDESDDWSSEYVKQSGVGDLDQVLAGSAQLRRLRATTSRFVVGDPGVNTPDDEFSPAWIDNGKVMFSSARERWAWFKYNDAWTGDPFTDLYYADRSPEGKLSNATLMSGGMNSSFHDGPAVCDERTRDLYYTSDVWDQESKRYDLAIVKAVAKDDGWQPIGPVWGDDLRSASFHPALSPDGRTMYFASDRAGGVGGSDLYVSQFKEGAWGRPVLVSGDINTDQDELFPGVAPDGRLFFASNGHVGLGGLDVFMAKPVADGFDAPENVGAPVNSSFDDFGFIVDVTGSQGYFTSNRPGGKGGDDIYSFRIIGDYETVPYQCAGEVTTGRRAERRYGVTVTLCDAEMHPIASTTTGQRGEFAFDIEPGRIYAVKASWKDCQPDVQWIRPNDAGRDRVLVRNLHLVPLGGVHVMGSVTLDDGALSSTKATISVVNTNTIEATTIEVSAGGHFHHQLPSAGQFDLYISEPGYWTTKVSLSASVKEKESKLIDLSGYPQLRLEPIPYGQPVELGRSIDAASGGTGTGVELLAGRLSLVPDLHVEITGCTGLTGKSGEAEVRAQVRRVMDDLVAAGVRKDRLHEMIVDECHCGSENAQCITYRVIDPKAPRTELH